MGRRLWSHFRVLNDAAPLKPALEPMDVLILLDFRVLNDAAPLKLETLVGLAGHNEELPRPQRRGPIESVCEELGGYVASRTSASSTTRPH